MTSLNVAITGIGLVSPHGDQPDAVFAALMRGESALRLWDNSAVPAVVVGTASFDPTAWFSRMQLSGMDRVSQLAVAAAESARCDAGWIEGWDSSIEADRIGVYLGCGMGGAGAIEDGYRAFFGGKRMSPLSVVASMTNAPAAHVAMRLNVQGPVGTSAVACASSAVAIIDGARAVASGEIDIAIVGGSEALLVPGVVRAWQSMQTLATPDIDDPSTSCRPFSLDRSGLVLAEGAAVMVLESAERAARRGARPYAEIAGFAVRCDATHLAKPDVAGQSRALTAALRHSGLTPADIGYCNAHGTATRVGDVVECEALKTVWAEALGGLRVSSTKSMHGHLLGAAGALEAAITTLALYHRQLPPTANCTKPDPDCGVPLISGQGEDAPGLRAALSNSFAFGGTNAVLVFRRTGN